MAETGEKPHIEIAGKYSTSEDLRRRAQQEKEEKTATPKIAVKVEAGELADQVRSLAEGQTGLLEAFERQRLTMEQFLRASEGQSRDLVESLRGIEPKEERQRWVDAEYGQQFYTRFTPNLEPKFYQKLDSEQRRKFDARWQLARTTFVKRATAGLPDKYVENQELELLGKEQMEILYGIPGVRQMLEAYARAITEGEKVNIRIQKNGRYVYKEISFWDINDADTFEGFREKLRDKALDNASQIFSEAKEIKELGPAAKAVDREWWFNLFKKEADAIAWNWLWVGNLAESADSRYSWSGRASRVPAVVSAGEYKYVMHPQERFEAKSFMGHFWGAFGKWGASQARRIKNEAKDSPDKYDGDKDEVLFLPANRSAYWSRELIPGAVASDEKRREKGGRVFAIYTPECYPITSCRSFWEETTIEVPMGRTGKPFDKVPLLYYLVERKPIPWNEVSQDAWGIYMHGKFDKAVKLLGYFNPEKPLDIFKPGWAYEWANPILELFERLKPQSEMKRLRGEEKEDEQNPFDPVPPRAVKPAQTFSRLKSWVFYAAIGGVRNIDSKEPTINLNPVDTFVVDRTLRGGRVRYLTSSDSLAI